tara:strand:+ start:88 stop:492 length:405 start_codon:yes stop_codon:yes gene_type:complete
MKKLLKIPALLFGLMLIVSSCGKDTKSDDTSKDNNKELCSYVESYLRFLNDAKEAIVTYSEVDLIPQEEILRMKKEFDRLETESDKFLETRDGRTEADVQSNLKLLQSCPSYNAVNEFMANGDTDILDFIADFE